MKSPNMNGRGLREQQITLYVIFAEERASARIKHAVACELSSTSHSIHHPSLSCLNTQSIEIPCD